MSAKLTTFDTTIFFYALDRDGDSRTARARRLVELAPTANTVLMLQSLTELWSAVTRKRPEQRGRARDIVDELMTTFPVMAANQEDFTQALRAQADHHLPFWDAMLWAAANRAGCSTLLTEDFQDGRTLGGVTFRNPFKMTDADVDALFE
jgi:predicted nucleic acid-binding protein